MSYRRGWWLNRPPRPRPRKDDTTDTPTARDRPHDPVTSDDEPATGDDDADDRTYEAEDPDADWERMQDEGLFPHWL